MSRSPVLQPWSFETLTVSGRGLQRSGDVRDGIVRRLMRLLSARIHWAVAPEVSWTLLCGLWLLGYIGESRPVEDGIAFYADQAIRDLAVGTRWRESPSDPGRFS
jgi:hypothetical protein